MANVTIYPYNYLAGGTVTVTGDPDTGYPEARLYDHAQALLWKDTVTEAKNFALDYGAAVELDFLAIANHNFAGEDLQWQYSTDNFSGDVNDAVTDWTQSGSALIVKTMGTAQTKRYWRVTLSSMENPQCGEIYMSKGYAFEVLASPAPALKDVANVSWQLTVGGVDRATKWGQSRRSARYELFLSAAELTSFKTATALLDHYSRPFYLTDHEGATWLARLLGEPLRVHDHKTHTHVSVEVIEVL